MLKHVQSNTVQEFLVLGNSGPITDQVGFVIKAAFMWSSTVIYKHMCTIHTLCY